jgi:hypothetical protein
MEVDATVESVLLIVKTHVMDSLGWVGPDPGSWLQATRLLKLPRWDKIPS